jgi:uncharacterized membrane protein YdjX (TVP38/TMEM64 family)
MMYLIALVGVFVINIVPFFMPATWTVLSFFAIRYGLNFFALALIGAVAATLGRIVLANLSRLVIRQRFMGEKTKKNIDYIKERIENRQKLTFVLFLSYAFSPLPSNQLFVAYGLTGLPVRNLAIPFFIGRIVSYTFWTFSAAALADKYLPENIESAFGLYFIGGQIFLIALLFVFAKIDWRKLINKKQIDIIK